MPSAGFVHLHVHSAYSRRSGAPGIAELAELARLDRQPALALTDTDNMFGVLEFSTRMAKVGIQPIVGCELAIDFDDQDFGDQDARDRSGPARLVLLAAQERGYRCLMRLNGRAFLETADASHIRFDWLEGESEGLIALTGGADGAIARALAAGHAELALARCGRLAGLFGDRLYIELQRHALQRPELQRPGFDEARRIEAALIDIAYAKSLPLVAAAPQLAATEGERLMPDQRLTTRAAMAALFADLPEALASTVEIAQRCAFRPIKARAPVAAHAADVTAHPVELIAAEMTRALGNPDRLAQLRVKAERLGVVVAPPDINRSAAFFAATGTTIRYALAALKGVSRTAAEGITEERDRSGPFISLADFAVRASPHAIDRAILESLAASGAFDTLEPNRARIFAGADVMLAACQRASEAAAGRQNDMFGATEAPAIMLPQTDPWLPAERLRREQEAIGISAERMGEGVRAPVPHAEPPAAATRNGLRIFLRDTRALDSIAKRLAIAETTPASDAAPCADGDGEVSLVMMLDLETEVEMKLPGRFKVSPQIASAIKAVAGVVDVQQV
jgi:DNA polymerase III alpha subunit